MARVLSVSTAERTLLKGFTGGVADLAFAHLNSNQLACLDEAGNLFVWRLAMEDGKIQYPVPQAELWWRLLSVGSYVGRFVVVVTKKSREIGLFFFLTHFSTNWKVLLICVSSSVHKHWKKSGEEDNR